MQTEKYVRRPFYADSVQVKTNNIKEVAQWCNGKLIDEIGKPTHIEVDVVNAVNDRHTRAYVGDWILFANNGFKVYTPKAFETTFQKLEGVAADAATQASKPQPVVPRG